jgi:L-cysteine desulfidase
MEMNDCECSRTGSEERDREIQLKQKYTAYLNILKIELVPALGCTEPIAVALAGAKAREVLGTMPEEVKLSCSANILKNVKSVTVPRTGGLKGVEAAVLAGMVGGDANRGLEVLESLGARELKAVKELLGRKICRTELAEGVENLYIAVWARAGSESVEVFLKDNHTGIYRITKNGRLVYENDGEARAASGEEINYDLLGVRDILKFADEVAIEDVREILGKQIRMNEAIAEEGLKNQYGVNVGKFLLSRYGKDIWTRAKAKAAAGSDARMGGCPLPVVINSGSGNQGMAVSLPVIEYAKELGGGVDRLYRALVVSNLIAIHQKRHIGKLSAYCGAVSAACGSGAGISYLYGGGYEEISRTITNTIANVGGIICDGAKASCAAKIASAVDAAIMGHYLSCEGRSFRGGDGLVGTDVEQTISNIGRVGSVGMKSTDVEVIQLMLGV